MRQRHDEMKIDWIGIFFRFLELAPWFFVIGAGLLAAYYMNGG